MPSGPKIKATFKLKGADSLVRLAQGATARVRAAARGVIATYVIKIERKLKKELSTPGSGKTYTRDGTTHQASAPGESPATDTNRYKSNIRHELRRMSGKVVGDVKYAAPLEFGTQDIEPRPMWRPILNEEADNFFDDLGDAIRQAL